MSEFIYSRLGDCVPCGGTGRIYKYKHIAGGLCFSCNGTGGKWLPEGAYKVYRRLTMCDHVGEVKGAYLGVVQRKGRTWWARGLEYKSRDAAAKELT